VFCFFPAVLAGQKAIQITGTVADGEGRPIELAQIGVEGSVGAGANTDVNGFYSLRVTLHDTIAVVFSCVGYKSARRVVVASQGDFTLNIALRSTEWELGEVVVTASRNRLSSMHQINADKIKIMPDASGGNIESIIIMNPGVSSNNELSSQYSVRGGNFDENMVYVNGIEVYRPFLVRSGQQEGLSFINPDMAAEVNFSAGGFDAKYGDKMSSVLDIRYKKPTRTIEGSLSASFLGSTAYVGQKSGRFSQIHGFRYKRATSLLGTLDTKGEYDPDFIDYQMYITCELHPAWEVGLLGNFSRNRYNFIPKSRTTSFGTLQDAKRFEVYFDGREQDEFLTGFGALSLTNNSIRNTKLTLTVSAFTTSEKETYDITGEYWLNNLEIDTETNKATVGENLAVGSYHEHARNRLTSRVVNISHTGSVRLKSNELLWGFNFQQEQIDDRIREWERRDSAGYNWPHTQAGIAMAYNLFSRSKTNSLRFNAYMQNTYKIRINEGIFAITAGVRAGHWDFNNEWIFSPRFNIACLPNWKHDVAFRLATGIYYQSPFYKEIRDTVQTDGNTEVLLNRQIKSQRSWQIVGGMDYRFKATVGGIQRFFKFSAEIYYKKLNNMIPYNVDNVRIRYAGQNISSGYAMGIDFKFFGEFVPESDSWLSFSLMKSEETIRGVTVPRPTNQLYNISLFFQDFFPKHPKWKGLLRAHLADGLPFASPNAAYESRKFKMTPYRRVDLGISRQLLGEDNRQTGFLRYIRSIWIGIDVFNLLDINNVNSYYWITDVYDNQYAVPNYLTGRQLNARLIVDF
jgi:hypothetical protein